jgi:hypothetical protein
MSASTPDHRNGTSTYDYRVDRPQELNHRNRRVGLIVALVAILLMLLSMAYIYWFGGINKGPMEPHHSSIVTQSVEQST